MTNTIRVHVIQSSEHLIHEYLGIKAIDRMHSHQLEVVKLVCLHSDVKIFIFAFFCSKGAQIFYDEGILQHFYYFQLSSFIFSVLLHSLQCHHLT